MRRIALALTMSLTAALVVAPTGPVGAAACEVNWVGADGGWDVGTNWSSTNVPTGGDVVCLPAGDYTVTVGSDASASEVTVSGDTVSGDTVSRATLVVDATLTVGNAGVNLHGGVLSGAGTIVGATVNNNTGIIRPGHSPGTLTITGNFTQAAGGTLEIEIAGTGAGQFDRLVVNGTATLAGRIAVNPTAIPLPGVQVVSATTLVGGTLISVGVPASWVGGNPSPPPLGILVTARQGFSDVPMTHTFFLDITWVAATGIANGYPDGRYKPGATLTRQALVAMLYRQAGSPDGADPGCPSAPFPDVPATHEFCGEITWASDNQIVNGYPGGDFKPANPVTRQAVVAMLYRLAGSPDGDPPTCSVAPFSDVAVGQAFCGEITWGSGHGIVNGYDDDTFRPAGKLTRQAIAAFLHRFATST